MASTTPTVTSTTTKLADGSTQTQTFTNGVLSSSVIKYPAGSTNVSDTKLYTTVNGQAVLTSDTVVHADKSKDVYLSNITGKSYVAEHDVYNAAGIVTNIVRTHADGTRDFTYTLDSDGTKTSLQYNANGSLLTSNSVVRADGSSDTLVYTNGVVTGETVIHADKTKDVYYSHIAGKTFVAQHDVFNAAGVLTSSVRTHADGTLDYTFSLGADGTKTALQYNATGSAITSRTVTQVDGSSDTLAYTNGVLTSETVVHTDKSKDVYLSNITGKTYVAEHDVYNSAGVLTSATRTHADGTLDYTYVLSADGTKTTLQYNANGSLASRAIVYVDNSSDTSVYSNGVLTSETVVHADKSKDIYLSNITGKTYVAEHDVYNATGVLTSVMRTHADGTRDFTYALGADGTKTSLQYNANGSLLTSSSVVKADGSSDTLAYTNGVVTGETVIHADKSKDVYYSQIAGRTYVAQHDVFNAAGILTSSVRTHADGTLDYTFNLGADGTKTALQYDATGSALTSRTITKTDGSSDTFAYTKGVLTSETALHADKTKDVYLSNITGKTYVAEHDVYNAAGVLTSAVRTHADGTRDFTYTLGADGTKTSLQYNASGSLLTSSIVVKADGSSDTLAYTNGIVTGETVVHADKSKDVYYSQIAGRTYVAQHDIFDAAGVLTSSVRTHADGTLDYTYTLGADGTKTALQYNATGSTITSRSIVKADGSSDTLAYTNGVLTSETVAHVDKTKDVYLSNITGKTFVAEHDIYNAAGVLTNIVRTHADGTRDFTYTLDADGTKTSLQYNADGSLLTSSSVVKADGSSDTLAYTNGVLTSETVVHADKSKDVYLSNITGKTYVAEHDVYNVAGVLISMARSHADGTLDYTYVLGADGTKTTDYFDTTGVLKSEVTIDANGTTDTRTYANVSGHAVLSSDVLKYPTGSTDISNTKLYTVVNGQATLTTETVLHADNSKDVFLTNAAGTPYVSEHDVYDATGFLKSKDQVALDGTHTRTVYSSGADESFTSSGSETLVFKFDFGHDTIASFDFGSDHVEIDSTAFTSVSDMLQNHTTDTAAGAVIDDGHGNTLTFSGLSKADLISHQQDFELSGHHFFSADSLWNTPISELNVHYSDPNAIQNQQFKSTSLANTWVQSEDIFFTTPADAPNMKWTFDVLNQATVGGGFSSHGTLQITTPTDLTPTHASDGWVVFADPDGIHYWEAWKASYDSASQTWHASYLVEGDLNGTGWGTAVGVGAGVRASGASLLGGLITTDELNSLSINHAMAIELDPTQLKAGTNQLDQFVFPAVAADGGSVNTYKGTIPIGAHFALPTDLDIEHAGLTPEGLAVARAYQQYGGYVVDAAGHTASIAMVEEATTQQLADLRHDAAWIRDHLVMV
ncbi:beta strand repeat-containing protein [Bradyrhizobium arachidis]|uniref:beta strand repeat-containing protein n=1 Tax=Bradyrhizobium arachidis TaxID=858423 RepID=UPI0008E55316|nr:RHS repeat protein [Bradyrhizobium arachidis]SFV13732.1 hypothetical protein SAMN05192541_12097 [Bradyrhizobium arachidis]